MSTKYTLRFKLHRSLGNRGQTFWPHRKLTEKQKLILQTIPKKKLSGYGQDILLKRVLSALYGKLSATQMKYFWQKALSLSGKPAENFLFGLENRLETVIYRLNFFRSFREGRQGILHGLVCINGHPVTRPNFSLRPGDLIQIGQAVLVTSETFSKPSRELHSSQALQFNKQIISFQSVCDRIKKNWQEKACTQTRSLHLEVCHRSLSAIFLFSPQQILYPLEFELQRFG